MNTRMNISSFFLASLLFLSTLAGCSSMVNTQAESQDVGSLSASGMTVSTDVDTPPEIIHEELAEYPRIARAAGLEGTVWLQVAVDTLGIVRQAEVKTSSGTKSLDESALTAVWKYRFKPAMKNSSLIPVTVSFPIEFRLQP